MSKFTKPLLRTLLVLSLLQCGGNPDIQLPHSAPEPQPITLAEGIMNGVQDKDLKKALQDLEAGKAVADDSEIPLAVRAVRESQNNLAILKYLKQKGVKLDKPYYGATALRFAVDPREKYAQPGSLDVVRYLLQEGLSARDHDDFGHPPLHYLFDPLTGMRDNQQAIAWAKEATALLRHKGADLGAKHDNASNQTIWQKYKDYDAIKALGIQP